MERRYAFKRSDKIAERIKIELSDLFLREVQDPRIGAITIVGVDVESDLSSARVRVCRSMLGELVEPSDEEKKKLVKALKSAAPFIFERLKRRLQIRHTPWIQYQYDDSLAKSAKVWAILSKEAQKRGEDHESSDITTAE